MLFTDFFIVAAVMSVAHADEFNHRYVKGDKVNFYVHKVGPYANPQEAYNYYDLPYCAPDNEHHPSKTKADTVIFNELKSLSIGEHLGGHSLRHSGHSLVYAPSQKITESCKSPPLSQEDADKFALAVENQWIYQMYLDDLPVWGMVGEMLKGLGNEDKSLKPYVYTKRSVHIQYNMDRIIRVELNPDPASLCQVQAGKELEFEMEFVWSPTSKEFHSRFDVYLDDSFFKHSIHWFSIFNSFMMVLFLLGLVTLILVRTLRRDFARYAVSGSGRDLEDGSFDDDEQGLDENGKPIDEEGATLTKGGGVVPSEDSGWKLVHGDVFRAPSFLPIYAAILGTGWQLIVLTLSVILFTLAGPIHGEVHEDRGEIQHAILICHCLSSVISGYSSGSYFKAYSSTSTRSSSRGKTNSSGDSQWQVAMFLTVVLFPTLVVAILSILNTIALVYGTINYIPFFVIVKVFFVWVFVSVPLCVIGTLAGRHAKMGGTKKAAHSILDTAEFPCRVNAIARPIPDNVPWYGKPLNLIPFAGLLSFGSIFIELYYVLTSLWNYKYYHVYGFLFGVYAILSIVVSMTTIIVIYFCLNSENYNWQWISIASGASTAGYVFLYGIYYFHFKTAMTGFLQTMFYFGYMSLIALSLGSLCGTIGHFSASRFVRTIFQNVKVD